MKGYLYLC
jgi:hypothetical protein